jgi:MFS transporter, FHS family, Na+ dependent glucose transporter 1
MRVLTETSQLVRTTTLLYYACFVMLGLVAASLGPILPYLATNTKSTLQAVSILLAARASGGLLGALFGARLYDYLSGHSLIAVVFLGLALCLVLIPFIPLLWVLAVCLLILGILQSIIDAGTNTLLVWLHKDKVAPFMNGLHFAFGLGAFLMPIVIAQSSFYLGSPGWAFALVAFLALPLSFSFWRTASPMRLETRASQTDAQSNTTLVALIAVFLFFYAGIEISFGNWIYSYAIKRNLADDISANYLTSAFWGTYTLGRLVTIPLAARLRASRLLWLCLVSAVFAVVPMLLLPASQTAVWASSLWLGLSIAAIFPSMISFAERHMTIKGQTMGIFFTGMSLGAISVPWLIGQLFESFGPGVLLVAVSISLIMGIVTLYLILRHVRKP